MKRKSIISQIMKMASLLAIVLAIAFTLPPSAHASMTHNTPDSIHESYSEQDINHTTVAHDAQIEAVDCGVTHQKSDGSHESGVQCCSSMHTSAMLLTFGVMSVAEETRSHLALPQSQMTSADATRLMRPPSL